MKTLIITAQPSSKGFVHQIAKQYEGSKKSMGEHVELIDLYSEEYTLPFLKFEDAKNIDKNSVRENLQEKIKNADELVFIFPLWWGDMPAILKNFIDQTFTTGFAFEYKNKKPTGLLTKKTAKIVVTFDAPKFFYFFTGFPLKNIFTKKILKFCGIKTLNFKTYGSISSASSDQKKNILKEITDLAL
jgi:NAD(P)H dehydrogenase (quinone)